MMNRRRFVGASLTALLSQSVAQAQPAAKLYRIGFMLGATEESVASLFNALDEGLRDLGYVEGRNFVFERRYAAGKIDRLPELAAELVRMHVDVIVTGTNIHVAAARAATETIPIVMVFAADPVKSGFVKSLARPGGNITGLSADASPELWAKYLALLKEIDPNISRVGVLGQVASQVGFSELEQASRKLSIAIEVADIRSPENLNSAFDALVAKQIGALLIVVGPLTYLLREPIAELALKHRLPSITNTDQFVQAGLLISYGPNLTDLYRRAASYVDKILHGASPADLPVEQPTKFKLVINLKAAKTLGLTIPSKLLFTADEVIE